MTRQYDREWDREGRRPREGRMDSRPGVPDWYIGPEKSERLPSGHEDLPDPAELERLAEILRKQRAEPSE